VGRMFAFRRLPASWRRFATAKNDSLRHFCRRATSQLGPPPVANCRATGAFPAGGDFFITSGTYTSVDQGPSPAPEPSFVLMTGLGMAGLVLSRRMRKRQ